MKICENCGGGYNNGNRAFCNRECQQEFSRRRNCCICGTLFLPTEDMNPCHHICSTKCEKMSTFYENRYYLQVALGISPLCRPRHKEFDLIDLKYSFRDIETGEILNVFRNFDEELKAIQEGECKCG